MNPTNQVNSPLMRISLQSVLRIAVVAVGLVIVQCFLFAPALFGRMLLLPVDLLMLPGFYLPDAELKQSRTFSDWVQSDQILQYEPARRFVATEIRAGRWPAWSPYHFCGSPSGGTQWSCFQFLYILWPTPRILSLIHILVAIVAGTGAYVFFRRVFKLAFWPATVAAWCYPLTGFFVLWQGHSLAHSAAWLPWILWATDSAVRNPRGFGGVNLAFFTFLTIGCGAVDIAGQVLLIAGFYAIWRLLESIIVRQNRTSAAIATLIAPAAGWGLGFVLAAGMLLPVADYLPTGARMRGRAKGAEERPPIGIQALPLVVLPELYGATRRGSFYIRPRTNLPESPASAYAGLIAALFLAPLAFSLGTHRSEICFLCVCGFLGMAWALNVPGLVQIFRMPLLNMFSFNRFTFVTGWAITSLAALGLECLLSGRPQRRWRNLIYVVLLFILAGFCLISASKLPEPVASVLEEKLRAGVIFPNLSNLDEAANVKKWFVVVFQAGATTCVIALIGWAYSMSKRIPSKWLFTGASGALLIELLRFASRSALMSESEYYYPRIPVLEQLAQAPAGRFLGVNCLPPRIVEHLGLRDIRGYDAVDPAGIVELLDLARDENHPGPPYARTQWYVPKFYEDAEGNLRIPGVLNQLNLRYLVFPAPLREKIRPLLSGNGYWIYENRDALPALPKNGLISPPFWAAD